MKKSLSIKILTLFFRRFISVDFGSGKKTLVYMVLTGIIASLLNFYQKPEIVYASTATIQPISDIAAAWSCTAGTDGNCTTGHYTVLDDGITQPDTPGTSGYIMIPGPGSKSAFTDTFGMTTISGTINVSSITVWAFGNADSNNVKTNVSFDGGSSWQTDTALGFTAGPSSSWHSVTFNGTWNSATQPIQIKLIHGATGVAYTAISHAMYAVVTYTLPVSAPTVTTQAASSVEATTATCNGNITVSGGENATARGCEWDTNSGAPYANSASDSGSYTTGAFTKGLTSLPSGTTIYARAFATNSGGTGYGSEVNFLTKPAAPTNVAATDGTYTDKVTITWTKSTGATDYHVWRDSTDLGSAGDVATFDDTGAAAPTITAGSAGASDGTSTSYVSLSVSGASANNGTTYTYKVVASNATGNSADSSTNTGYRGVGSLTYQWQRSAADSDASYSNIDGATASTYNDTGAPSDGSGRYYKVILNATGASQQTSASNRGYRIAPPTFSSAATNTAGTLVTVTFSKAMADPAGKHAQFTVLVGGSGNTVTAAALNADTTKIDLTLTSVVYNGQTVTVAYTAGTVVAADTGILATFGAQSVTNNSTVYTPPTFSSAATNTAGTTVTVTFSKAMADPVGKHAQFTVLVDAVGDTVTVAALNADTTKIDLTLTTVIKQGQTVTVAYTAGTVVAADTGILATFGAQSVSNNSTVPSAVAPTVTLSAASSVTSTLATMNGDVTATGGENPTVTVYWGLTDGGTTPASWQNSSAPSSPAQPQAAVSFSESLAGLTPNTTYYFSAKATNSAGTDWPDASLSFTTTTGITFNQEHFKIYQDDASLNSATQYASEDTNYNMPLSTNFRLRIQIANVGTAATNITRSLEFRKNGGAWTTITTSGNDVNLVNSTQFTDATATTSRLTATGTFTAGQGKDTGSDTTQISLTNAYYVEDEYALKFETAASGNTYQFRITNAGTPLDRYSAIPTISAGAVSVFKVQGILRVKGTMRIK